MGNLASIMGTMNVMLGSNMLAGTADSSAAKSFVDQLTKPQFDGIINSIDNVYRWTTEQKLAFYSSVKSIPVFNEKLDELQKNEHGRGSA